MMTFRGQCLKILHRPQLGLDPAEIRHGIAAVRAILWAFEERHQVQIVDAAFLDIVDPALESFEVIGKVINIQHHPDK